MRKQIFLAALLLLSIPKFHSQIAGSFTVPGSFPTIAAAVNTLNLIGVAGAVTINVAANYTETVPTGGLKLINPPGSTTTSITFKKLGAGANPLLLAYTGGTATGNSNQRDGIWMFVDCRNITVDGIDLFDPNTTQPATMEFGYGFYKSSGNAANRNNTIRNCAITLGSPNTSNSRGIEVSYGHYLFNTSNVAPTSTAQTNSYNTFYNNLIQKCEVGIYLSQSGGSTLDVGNDIGGVSAVTGNTVINFGGGGGVIFAIYADYQSQCNISCNVINNLTGSGSRGIYLSGIDETINSNTITLNGPSATSAIITGITHNGLNSSTGTVNINNNIFPGFSYTAVSSGFSHSVISTSGNGVTNVMNNQIGNFTCGTGTVNFISVTGASNTFINNNAINGATFTANGWITGINCSASYPAITNNTIGNFWAPGASTSFYASVYGIKIPWTWSATVTGNSINNIYGNALYGISITSTVSAPTYSIANNMLSNFSAPASNTIGCSPYGILATTSSTNTGTVTIVGNIVSNLAGSKVGSQTYGGRVEGIIVDKSAKALVYRNKVSGLSSNGTDGVAGINMSGAQNFIYNNLVGDMQIASSGNIRALALDAAGTSRVHFNSLYLNTGTSTNSQGVNLISSINNSVIELKNNILVNTSTGPVVPAILIANNVMSTSNNNSFYFGTGGRIFRTVPSSSVLSGYQSIFNSDSQSFIENPNFQSTTGSSPNFLNINTTIPTQIESGAVAISTITTDYIGAVRSATPDVGAWEGNFTAADATPPVVVSSGFTGPPCNGSTRTFTANITDASAVATGSVAPRLYYRINFGLYTSVQGTLASGTTTNGVWSFPLSYSAVLNDVIWYFLAVQDTSYLNNLRLMPNTSASATDVNNVGVPPNPAYNYTIQTYPTISLAATSATICAGQTYVIQASGASSYTYLPGNSATVAPVVNTVYTVTGASSLGCPSTNTLTLSLAATPVPTITVNSGSICAGSSFVLVPSGAITYTYSGGTPTVTPSISTMYTVSGSNAAGCVSSALSNVLVQALPVIILNNGTICAGDTFTIIPSGAFTYTYSGGTATVSPSSNTNYTVWGSGAGGCVGSNVITVNVNALPVINISSSSATLCVGQTATLVANGATTYTWSTGTINSTEIITPSVTSVYSVSASDNGCGGTGIFTQVVDPCAGLKEFSEGVKLFKITPNPGNGLFKLVSGTSLNIEVYTSIGQKTMSMQCEQEASIDLTGYAKGVYFIYATDGQDGKYTAKIILTE